MHLMQIHMLRLCNELFCKYKINTKSIGNLTYLLVISSRTAGVVEKLGTPDPHVNHYIVLVLLLASLPYQFVEESVVEGRRV